MAVNWEIRNEFNLWVRLRGRARLFLQIVIYSVFLDCGGEGGLV